TKPVTKGDFDETPLAVDTARATAEPGQAPVLPVTQAPVEEEPKKEPRRFVYDDAGDDDDLDVPEFLT
ncbi:MAG: hypothetical protein AB7V23_14860, partial [Candidatus Nanopelagicales bacterium]